MARLGIWCRYDGAPGCRGVAGWRPRAPRGVLGGPASSGGGLGPRRLASTGPRGAGQPPLRLRAGPQRASEPDAPAPDEHVRSRPGSCRDDVLRLGASHLNIGQPADEGHIVLADPEGNEFCVIEPDNAYLAGAASLANSLSVALRASRRTSGCDARSCRARCLIWATKEAGRDSVTLRVVVAALLTGRGSECLPLGFEGAWAGGSSTAAAGAGASDGPRGRRAGGGGSAAVRERPGTAARGVRSLLMPSPLPFAPVRGHRCWSGSLV